MLDPFELLVQCLSVPGYLAQIPFDAYELLAGTRLGILYDRFRHAHLAGQLECEGVARQSHLQLEHRSDVLYVKHHRSVDHSCVCRCI